MSQLTLEARSEAKVALEKDFGAGVEVALAAGAVAGFLQYEQVQQGATGAPVLVRQYQYTARTAGSM